MSGGSAAKKSAGEQGGALPPATVIIPTRNAGPLFEKVMDRVASQDYPSYDILVVDTSSSDDTREIARSHGASVHVIPQDTFSHGGTRNLAASLASGRALAFLSQDAMPATREWLREIVAPLANPRIAGVCGGQIPHEDASPMERFFYLKRFPQHPKRRSLAKGKAILLDDIFFSNVNSAMLRETLLRYPFHPGIIMSEDQEWAKRVLLDGRETLYEPRAAVIHSHYYTLKSAFLRYFDSAYSLMQITDETFRSFTAAGFHYTWEELRYTLSHDPLWVPYLLCYDFSKMAGTFFGRQAGRMPRKVSRMMSLHKYHWDRPEGWVAEPPKPAVQTPVKTPVPAKVPKA